MQKTEVTKTWRATLYLRLSREDGDKEESNSITGQRNLLRDFLKRHTDIQEYAVKIDDGWSGSSFERPSFKEMMEDVKVGRTDCIIVKDACVIIEPTRKGPFERLSWPGSICF